MIPPPYTIPDGDRDLWTAGCVLTPERLFAARMSRFAQVPFPRALIEERRRERAYKGKRDSVQGRLNWLRYVLGLGFAKPDPRCVDRFLRDARAEWGEGEYARLFALTQAR